MAREVKNAEATAGTGPTRHPKRRRADSLAPPYQRPVAAVNRMMDMVKQVADSIAGFFRHAQQNEDLYDDEHGKEITPPVASLNEETLAPLPVMLGELREVERHHRPRALPILRPFSQLPRPAAPQVPPVIFLEKRQSRDIETEAASSLVSVAPLALAPTTLPPPPPPPTITAPLAYNKRPAVFSAKFAEDDDNAQEEELSRSMLSEDSPKPKRRHLMAYSSSPTASPSSNKGEVKPRLKPLVFAPPLTVIEERDRLLKQLEILQKPIPVQTQIIAVPAPVFDFGLGGQTADKPQPKHAATNDIQPQAKEAVPAKTTPAFSFAAPGESKPVLFAGLTSKDSNTEPKDQQKESSSAPLKFSLPPIAEQPSDTGSKLISFSSPIKVPEKPVEMERGSERVENGEEEVEAEGGMRKRPSPLSFSFDAKPAQTFALGNVKPAEATADKPIAMSAFSFGVKPAEEKPPAFSFTAKLAEPAISIPTEPVKPSEKDAPKPFTFGAALAESKPFGTAVSEVKPFSFGTAVNEPKPFSFGTTVGESKPMAFGAAVGESKPMVFGAAVGESKSVEFGAALKPINFGGSVVGESKPFTFGSASDAKAVASQQPIMDMPSMEDKPTSVFASQAKPATPAFNFSFGAPTNNAPSQEPVVFGSGAPAAFASTLTPAPTSASNLSGFGGAAAVPSQPASFGQAASTAFGSAPAFSFGTAPSATNAPPPAFNFGGSPVFPPPAAPSAGSQIPSSSNQPIPASPSFSAGESRKISQPISKRRFK